MKTQFRGSGGDLCYYPLLYMALKETKGTILELGMGYGSTPLLNEFSKKKKRTLLSFDYSKEWKEKFDYILNEHHTSEVVTSWAKIYRQYPDADVIFIDQSPGEERKFTIEAYKNTKGILVIHDTEPTGEGDYRVRPLFHKFKYKAEVQTAGAWATALSNNYDLSKWVGEKFGEWTISN